MLVLRPYEGRQCQHVTVFLPLFQMSLYGHLMPHGQAVQVCWHYEAYVQYAVLKGMCCLTAWHQLLTKLAQVGHECNRVMACFCTLELCVPCLMSTHEHVLIHDHVLPIHKQNECQSLRSQWRTCDTVRM